MSVRPVAASFNIMLSRNRTTGFIDLVRPATLDELCAEQRLIRDLEEEYEAVDVIDATSRMAAS